MLFHCLTTSIFLILTQTSLLLLSLPRPQCWGFSGFALTSLSMVLMALITAGGVEISSLCLNAVHQCSRILKHCNFKYSPSPSPLLPTLEDTFFGHYSMFSVILLLLSLPASICTFATDVSSKPVIPPLAVSDMLLDVFHQPLISVLVLEFLFDYM